MASLRYPQQYSNDMPMVNFKAYEYSAPLPEIPSITPKPSLKAAGISEISLYMPGNVVENISATWEPEALIQGAGGNWGSLALSIGDTVADIQKSKLAKAIQNSVGAGFGIAPVPTDMLMFKSVNPISITLDFKMIPYNQAEGESIKEICSTFKQNIMPRVSSELANCLLQYPYVWDIWFSKVRGVVGIETGDNKIFGYNMMALTNCNVSIVSGTEGASVYKDHIPTQINLSLTFTHIKKHWIG